MEWSSSDSFVWTDASDDSNDNNVPVQAIGVHREGDFESGATCKQNERESKKPVKKIKKMRCSDTGQESSDNAKPKRKKKKLESDSDVEKENNSRRNSNVCKIEPQDSIVNIEECLNMKVKQEQASAIIQETGKHKKMKKKRSLVCDINEPTESHCTLVSDKCESENYLDIRVKQEDDPRRSSLVEPKRKKKHKQSDSQNDIASEPDSGKEATSFTDVRVKQEQVCSASECDIATSKKKKKRKSSILSSEVDIISEAKSVIYIENGLSASADQSEYSVIKENFSAEETVVEKPRKKKRKSEAVDNLNSDVYSDSMYESKKNEIIHRVNTDSVDDNDMSLQTNDFTCNNIVSSTIINSSAIEETVFKENNSSEDTKKISKEQYTQRISDRIRFEDDETSAQEPIVNTASPKIKMFLKANPHLELYTPDIRKNSINREDEIWALEWPHDVDIKKFVNMTLRLGDKYKIKIDKNTYEGVPKEDVQSLTLLTHHQGRALITNLPVSECISYHKRIPKAHIPNNNIMVNNQTNFIPLPETKNRHPLFGTNFKKSIKIPKAAAESLNSAKQRNSIFTKTEKRKKDKHKLKDVKVEEDLEPELEKKRKKRKHSEEDEPGHKKHKRAKHEPASPAAWDSERAIEENLFNF